MSTGKNQQYGATSAAPLLGSTDAPYPAVATAWRVVVLLLFAYVVAVMDRQILTLMVQPIRRDLDISDTQISLLHGFAFVITFTALGLFFGRVADRGNRRNLIIGGMLVWCLATAACGLARNYTELFLARMAVGVGEAALSPAAYSLIADYFAPGRRGRATGIYTMGTFVGSGVAMIAGALAILSTAGGDSVRMPLLGVMRSWQAAFIVIGLPGLLIVAAMLFVREPTRRERAAPGMQASTLGFLRANARILAVVIAGLACNALASFSLISWTPTVFIRLFAWDASTIGVVYGLILAIPGAAGIMLAGVLADRSARHGGPGPLALACGALALVIPTSLWVGLGASAGISLVALAVSSFLLAMPTGLAPLALYQLTPNEHRGQVIAIYLLAATVVGLGAGPTIVAATNSLLFSDDRMIGTALAIVTTTAAIAGCVLLAFAVRLTRARRHHETPARNA